MAEDPMEHKEYKKLHAEWYDLVSDQKDHSKEIRFWERCIKESSQPVLELGSGTGRILIPLLERGYDVTGMDTSEDMMERCTAKCRQKGTKVELHEASMLDFNLTRKYGLIILGSGGLGLFTDDNDIISTFQRVKEHMKPRGLFVFEFQNVQCKSDNDLDENIWEGDWVNGPDGVVIAWRKRWRSDDKSHCWECLFVIDKFVNGSLVETEANERTGRYFTVDEAVEYARKTGFQDIKATKWLTEEPPGRDTGVVTVKCRKPE
jgi:ubiquinone/menaquinone biosynthesis C-methylase UbiE